MNSSIELSGLWDLRAADESASVPCPIPGDNFSALQAAKRIPDPFWRENEKLVQWVVDKDWVFARTFDVPSGLLDRRAAFLSFDSIDTAADVFVNGRKVGSARDQFRRYRYEVKKFLRAGENRLEVRIQSPRKASDIDARKDPHKAHSTPNSTIEHMNALRKCQCSSGWDWGIALASSGLGGRTELFGADAAVLDYAWCEQKHSKGKVRVVAVAELTAVRGAPAGTPVAVRFAFGDQEKTARGRVPAEGGSFRVRAAFVVENPRLWWPVGYGEQPLYPFSAEAEGRKIEKKIGLRDISIDHRPDARGLPLTIRVNGTPVFAKGADWIPCDARPFHADDARVANLLRSAVDANMNCLRVWGGGAYERDFFYDECDRLGLLLWHDHMFACSNYPVFPEFLANVREEILHQTKRLRDHASIALWCGDNECIGAVAWYNRRGTPRYDEILGLYRILNDVEAKATAEGDPSRIFWPSSPSAGPGNFEYNDDGKPSGDTHFWGVWFSSDSFARYYTVQPRFCSEFGFQSYPSPETVRSFTDPDDRNVFSPVFERHQKCHAGNLKILSMFGNYFRMPKDFESMLYVSQVQQAFAIRTGAEYWRSLRPHCMGTIFWQLNDNWPVSSWSSLEYGGRWKALHHLAKRFFAPLAASAFRKGPEDPLEAHLVWDLPKKLSATTVATLRRISDGSAVASKTFRVAFAGSGAKNLAIPDWSRNAKARRGLAPNECFVTLETSGKTADGTRFTHSETTFLDVWKNCVLPVSKLRVLGAKTRRDGTVDIEVANEAPAFFAELAVPGDPTGHFEDNDLTLLPGRHVFRYRPGTAMPAGKILRVLNVRDLRSSY